jgi:hypothetical protein
VGIDPGPIPTGPPLQAFGADFSEMAGAPFANIVAVVKDFLPTASPGSLVATVNWGDGRITSGEIIPLAPGLFGVLGRGTYAYGGTYLLTLTVSDLNTGDVAVASDDVTVVAPPVPTGLPTTGDGSGSTPIDSTGTSLVRFDRVQPASRKARSGPRRHVHVTPHSHKVRQHTPPPTTY